MSFLSRRSIEQLATIKHVDFRYWITMKWSPTLAPLHQPGHHGSLENWVASIAQVWSENLERLGAMMPTEHLPKLSVDLSLIHPTVYTYRLRAGLSKEMLAYLKERLPVVTEEALTKFQIEGKWPDQGLVVDGTDDYSNRPVIAAPPPSAMQAVAAA